MSATQTVRPKSDAASARLDAPITIRLRVPDLWDELFDKDFLDTLCSRLDARKYILEWKELSVEGTGEDPEELIKECRATQADPHLVPLLILPVSHCALKFDDFKLRILGPIAGTQKDVFAYASRKLSNENGGDSFLNVGVKGASLTTTNMSRVALLVSCPSFYTFIPHNRRKTNDKDLREHWDAINKAAKLFCGQAVRHSPYYDVNHRLRLLGKKRLDAVILTGTEVAKANGLEDGRLKITDINELMCSYYDISVFPRAVLAAFEADFEKPKELAAINEFINVYNQVVEDQELSFYYNIPRARSISSPLGPSQSAQMYFRPTGNRSCKDEILTLLKFTEESGSAIFDDDRSPEIAQFKPRPLIPSDFVYIEDVFREEINIEFLLLLKESGSLGFADLEGTYKGAREYIFGQSTTSLEFSWKELLNQYLNQQNLTEERGGMISEKLENLWKESVKKCVEKLVVEKF